MYTSCGVCQSGQHLGHHFARAPRGVGYTIADGVRVPPATVLIKSGPYHRIMLFLAYAPCGLHRFVAHPCGLRPLDPRDVPVLIHGCSVVQSGRRSRVPAQHDITIHQQSPLRLLRASLQHPPPPLSLLVQHISPQQQPPFQLLGRNRLRRMPTAHD